MRLLCLVTARGGSKGFPGKNTARLAGRSLVSRSLSVLQRFRDSQPGEDVRIFLSTDSKAIASEWPPESRPGRLRPADLASDTASSLDVVRHELRQAEAEGFAADVLLLLQPTSPLVEPEDLDAAFRIFRAGTPSVLGMVPVDHPVAWTWAMDATGLLLPGPDESEATRRQDLETRYRPAGYYLVAPGFLEAEGRFIVPGTSRGVAVPPARGIDIDSPLDLAMAETVLAESAKAADFAVGTARVGSGHPCYVIAEAGVNHNGSLDLALDLVRAAAEAGADAVKFQTFKAERLVAAGTPMAQYQKENTGDDGGQMEMLARLELAPEQFVRICDACRDCGIQFLSTPFDLESARFLHGLDVPAFKVGSGELTNLPFLAALAGFGRPIILSTGMGDMEEVEAAVRTIREAGDPPLAILHCTSAYPASPEGCNLRAMESMARTFGVAVGYSDHTTGWDICLAAAARGAAILEKHFTLDRNLPGPDHRASLEPGQLKRMIQEIRRVEAALGTGIKAPVDAERDTRSVARKSLVLARAVARGACLQLEDLVAKRPGTGIPPSQWRAVIGRRLVVDGAADRILSWEDLEG